MKHRYAGLLTLVISCGAAEPALAQGAERGLIHDYLEQKLDEAEPADKLPVYFVMADQLRYEHWFPRINMMHVDQRRELVVAELKDHARRTQSDLLTELRRRERDGSVVGVRSIWIGNFVRCAATPDAVRQLSRMPGLHEVRYDAAWPADQVQDVIVPSPAPRFSTPTNVATTVSNGVTNTRADQVWALGYRGQGVLAMNIDTGANINHGDLIERRWVNRGEIPGNGIDDDDNGYIDDIHGFNFFDNNNVLTSGPLEHGTMTAGVMVADGRCSGMVTGQAPEGKVMFGAVGACCPQSGPVNPAGEAAQWEAVQYGIDNGAHVQTSSHSYKNSFTPPPNYLMHRIVGDNSLAAGFIRCNSTSNNGQVANQPGNAARIPFNVSSPGNIPCPYIDPKQELIGRKSGVVGCGGHNVNSNILEAYSPLGPFAWHLDDVQAVISYPRANWASWMNDYPWFGGSRQGLLKPDITGPTNTQSIGYAGGCGVGGVSGTSNSTPRVAGTMILWKGANMSLKPEDTAMIAHQTAIPTGYKPGKESGWGAGRVNALAGLYLALCTHRVNGEPAWSIDHKAGTPLYVEVDTLPNHPTVIAMLGSRSGPVLAEKLYSGSSGSTGDVRVKINVPPGAAGKVFYTQCFTASDIAGADGRLKSNVIEIRIVP